MSAKGLPGGLLLNWLLLAEQGALLTETTEADELFEGEERDRRPAVKSASQGLGEEGS